MDDKEKQQSDYLSRFVEQQEDINSTIREIKDTLNFDSKPSLEYINVDLNMLPLGIFYNPNIQIKIRAAKVEEIQNYSTVDDKNYIDVTEKMNQLLSSCVKVTLPNGLIGSYKDLKDGDRMFLVFMIRELTFQKGPSLAKDVVCEHCKHEFKIPFRSTHGQDHPKSFELHEMPEKLEKFFNREYRCFEFNINNVSYKMSPPTIGIQEIFFEDIKSKVQSDKNPNIAFLKIIPFTLWDRSKISTDGIKAKEDEFKRMDMYTFQVLNQAVEKMLFGIKGLKSTCPECGGEVHTDMNFPEGASSLFVIKDIFEDFIGGR